MKQRIEDLKIYHTLCKVMSKTQAKCELMTIARFDCAFTDGEDIKDCFLWFLTPQGERFWGDVYEKLQQLED